MSDEAFDMDLPEGGVASNGHTATAAGGDDALKQFLDDALASVLRTAQDQAAQMMQRARDASEAEAALGRQLREQAQRESDRMMAWRSQVEPLVQAVNDKAVSIRASIAEVPGRVANALAPVNDALADVDRVLGRLTDVLHERSDGPGGPAGPGGPGGGSRAFGTLGEAIGEDREAAPEPMATVHELQESTPVDSAETATQAASEETWTEASADGGAPEAAAETWSDDAAGGATLGPWVDWPTDASKGEFEPQAEASAETSAEADSARPESAPQMAAVPDPDPATEGAAHDEDDVALRSATSQLRRAVTDIDWHDLPSASNG